MNHTIQIRKSLVLGSFLIADDSPYAKRVEQMEKTVELPANRDVAKQIKETILENKVFLERVRKDDDAPEELRDPQKLFDLEVSLISDRAYVETIPFSYQLADNEAELDKQLEVFEYTFFQKHVTVAEPTVS